MQFSRSVSFWVCIAFCCRWHCTHTHIFDAFSLLPIYAHLCTCPHTHTRTYAACVCGSFYTWLWRSVDQINFMARRHFCPLHSLCVLAMCVSLCVCVSVSLCKWEPLWVSSCCITCCRQAVDQVWTIIILFLRFIFCIVHPRPGFRSPPLTLLLFTPCSRSSCPLWLPLRLLAFQMSTAKDTRRYTDKSCLTEETLHERHFICQRGSQRVVLPSLESIHKERKA